MAHRNIKITRDLVKTCNKVLISQNKSNLCTLPPHITADFSKNVSEKVHNKIQQTISDTIQGTFKQPQEEIVQEILKSNASPESLKLLNVKNVTMNLTTRDMSTRTATTNPVRSYSCKKNKNEEEGSCKYAPKKCRLETDCPRFAIPDCRSCKGSDCKRLYHDPCCTKKMAPYPSYSELCADRLEDDPSECHQCPWQKCGGVDAIKPQKKRYHTSTRPIMNMAMIPYRNTEFIPPGLVKHCDASKEPCKEPPPKCPKREKKEKCPDKPKKEKKCPKVAQSQSWDISGRMHNLDLQQMIFSDMKLGQLKSETTGNSSSLAQKISYQLKDCPDEKEKCRKFPHIKPHAVDRTIDNILIWELSKDHDKGNPPPCDDGLHPRSRNCPDNADKKKTYRHERDLYESTYRRNPKPYSEDP